MVAISRFQELAVRLVRLRTWFGADRRNLRDPADRFERTLAAIQVLPIGGISGAWRDSLTRKHQLSQTAQSPFLRAVNHVALSHNA